MQALVSPPKITVISEQDIWQLLDSAYSAWPSVDKCDTYRVQDPTFLRLQDSVNVEGMRFQLHLPSSPAFPAVVACESTSKLFDSIDDVLQHYKNTVLCAQLETPEQKQRLHRFNESIRRIKDFIDRDTVAEDMLSLFI